MSSESLPEKLSDGGVKRSVTSEAVPAVSLTVAGLVVVPSDRAQW